jgi:DNA-binding LytR/AlgR family response regulator
MPTLKIPGSQKPLPVESILWIEGDSNYAWIHFSNRPKLLATQTLKWFAEQLPSFIRVHKSSLVNVAHLILFEQINSREARVILTNRVALLVSRRRVRSIADLLRKIAFETEFATLVV